MAFVPGSRNAILSPLLALLLMANVTWTQMGVGEYGGSPGLVVDGEPAPALFAANSTPPGSYLVDGRLHLAARRNQTATLTGTKELPDSFTLEAEMALLEAMTSDGNIALRFHVNEGGQQAYLLILRHNPNRNQVSLTRSIKGEPSKRMLEETYAWRVETPVRIKLIVQPGSLALSINDEEVDVVQDPSPLPGGKLRLTAYSSRGSLENLRVVDPQGRVILADGFDDVSSSEHWTNWKQLLRARDGHAPSFAEIGLHLYHDTDTKGGAANLADGKHWSEPGTYDWSSTDRYLKALADRDPDGRILGRVNVNSPKWWLKANPEHQIVRIDPDTGKRAAGSYASFSSPKWRDETAAAIRAYLRHLKQRPEGHRIRGLIVGAGGSAEWVHSWGIQFHDYSPVQVAAFRAWLGQRYGNSVEKLRASWKDDAVAFDTAEIPLPTRRLAGDVGEFNPLQPVKILLPQEGLYGLSAGSPVEILGTTAGQVHAIVIDPDQQIHADVFIRRDMRPFVRQDSQVYIRKRFGVAGDSFLEITRGFEQPLDWDYAVLKADPDRAPTDLLQSTLQDLRDKAVPVLRETHRAITAYADLGEQMADPQGKLQTTLASLEQVAKQLEGTEGLIDRLLSDDTLADELQTTVQRVNDDLTRLAPVLDELQKTSANTTRLTAALADQGDNLPQITQRLTENLDELQAVLKDLRETTPRLPEVTDALADSTAGIPALVIQTQSTLVEVEKLAESLRSSWLLGGGGGPPAARGALAAEEAMP